MQPKLNGKENKYEIIFFYALAITMVSLAFSIRFLNSISIALLPLAILIHPRRKQLMGAAFRHPVFISFLVFFLFQLSGWFYTSDVKQHMREMEIRTGMLVYPFFFCAISNLDDRIHCRLMWLFSLSLSIVCAVCLFYASWQYSRQSDASVFFYHDLVSLFHHHAVFFSFFLFYCIIYWLETGLKKGVNPRQKKWIAVMVLFFMAMMVLLSSKLVLILILLYGVFFMGRHFYKGRKRWILPVFLSFIALLIALLALTENPVKKRFADITTGSTDLFRQETFSPEIYFNGVQFRLLTWRFTGEILDQKNAWLSGVSAGDAQHELNRRYAETKMYLGDGSGSGGFRGFDCHNVYLQTLLESGVLGLILFLIACGFLLAQAIKNSNVHALVFLLALLIFGFSETVLSTQYALQLFLFFPLLAMSREGLKSKV
jgi:O-antigen ligase